VYSFTTESIVAHPRSLTPVFACGVGVGIRGTRTWEAEYDRAGWSVLVFAEVCL